MGDLILSLQYKSGIHSQSIFKLPTILRHYQMLFRHYHM